MKTLSRISLYHQMIEEAHPLGHLHKILQINLIILSRIEELFLSEDFPNTTKEINNREINEIFKSNIQRLEDEFQKDNLITDLKSNLNKLVETNEDEKLRKNQNVKLFFNKILKELGNFNNNWLLKYEIHERYISKPRGTTQVFLSYAYDDKLYSLALFYYFYNQNIYLFVDWMHNARIQDGRILKQVLKNELDRSEQLVFLRTPNSELNIQGNYAIRPWCTWELGNFYNKSNEKYLINLYSIDNYENQQLHGLKIYSGIVNDRLVGIEIAPTRKK